eukprot:m.137417 g.137417  ORF g.137417 m.137417 type:complete len:224 (-) comp29920_c0_seq1:287-958(-)
MALTLALTRQNLASFVNRIPQPFSTAERLRRFLGGSAVISESEGTPTPSSCSSVYSETPTVVDQPVSLYRRKYRIADLRQLLPNHDEVDSHVQPITKLICNPTTVSCNKFSNINTTTTNQPTNVTSSPAPVRSKETQPPCFKIKSLMSNIQPKSTGLVQNAPNLSLGQSRLYQKRMKNLKNKPKNKSPPNLTVSIDNKTKLPRDAATLISAYERKLDLHPLRA